jgi:FAD/FMN-containing dehydrogenase
MIDRRPAAIACCSGPADVHAAVCFAAEEDLFPAIRGGGHNAAGLATVDDGLVIDLSDMKGIFVDSATRTVVAQTGLTWGEFNRESHVCGLATTGGLISTTGIAGLTRGGGVGWLMGRCGLVCDNTLNYDLVLASGEMVRANASESTDLFWALKGGGGNFGAVTSITYRMYPVKEVLSGLLLYPLSIGRDVLRFYRDFTSGGIPDELTMYATALSTPDGIPVVALTPVWCGDIEEGERVLNPVRTFGSPIADQITRMPYPAMLHSAMERWSTHLVYVNALDQDDVARIPQAYGPNYKRLCEAKAKYDPENRFRRNQNIRSIANAH